MIHLESNMYDEGIDSEMLLHYEEEMKRAFMNEALEELEQMSEKEACIFYNTDTKEEARQGIIEYWTWIA